MIPNLIATVVTVSCGDISALIDRAKVYPHLENNERTEIIDLYIEFGKGQGLDCEWDAND